MLLTFLLALGAGFVTPQAEPWLERVIGRGGQANPPLDTAEFRVLTLLVLFGAVALIVFAAGANSSAFALALGGGLGFFAKRIYTFLRDPDGVNQEVDEPWDGRVDADGAPPDAPAARASGGAADGPSPRAATDPDKAALDAVTEWLNDDTKPREEGAPR